MAFEPLDRPLYWEFGYWAPTVRRWYGEGLPQVTGLPGHADDSAVVCGEYGGIDWRNPFHDADINRALGFDEFVYRIPVNNLYCPPFEPEVLEDHPQWYRARDGDGQIVEISKLNGSRRHLESPVKTRHDYQRLREERLQPKLDRRLPANWPDLRDRFSRRTFPVMYGGMQGFFNSPRRLLGFERLMTTYYDDPRLIKEIINDVVDLLMALYDPLLSDVGGDYAMISEDMCYKGGCLVSPVIFREFMLPAYRKLTGFYRDHGITTIIVDSDGDVSKLIPLLVEGGVTGLQPFEVTGACSVTEIRQAFPRFQIIGGLDKKAIALGKEAIDAELESKVPFLCARGGYIPSVDHTVPPDISWDNFRYYRRRLTELAPS